MNIFIIGGTGLLGCALLRSAPKQHTIFASFYENKTIPKIKKNVEFIQLDIRDKKKVFESIEMIKPDVIILTAAKSSPDYCEKNKKIAWDTNVIGTRNVVKAAKKYGGHVFFMSSNQVFSGSKPPYLESSRRDPVNYYGKTKVQSENDLKKHSSFVTVLRLMTMYGWANPDGTQNSAVWTINMLSQKKPIKVVDDVYNNFLYVEHAASIIWKLVKEKNDISLVQLAGRDDASRYDFAILVAEEFNLNKALISPVKKSYFTDEAPRPLNTIYDTTFLEKKLSIKPLELKKGIRDMHMIEKKMLWTKI